MRALEHDIVDNLEQKVFRGLEIENPANRICPAASPANRSITRFSSSVGSVLSPHDCELLIFGVAEETFATASFGHVERRFSATIQSPSW